jgi:hypothetical protein
MILGIITNPYGEAFWPFRHDLQYRIRGLESIPWGWLMGTGRRVPNYKRGFTVGSA